MHKRLDFARGTPAGRFRRTPSAGVPPRHDLQLLAGLPVVIGVPAPRTRDPFGCIGMLIRWDGDEATLLLRGELDMVSAPAVSAQLTEILARDPQRLTVDLAGVVFMDCAGIAPLVTARRALPPGCPLILRSPGSQARTVLRVTGLDRLCLPGGTRDGK